MGGKSQPEIPEAYDLDELLKYNTDLNRFDSVNPFGSQKWSEQENGRWLMTQEPSPLLQSMMHDQFDFVNRGPDYYEGSPTRDAAQQRLQANMMRKHGGLRSQIYDVPSSTPPDPASYRSERPEAPAVEDVGPPVVGATPPTEQPYPPGQRPPQDQGIVNKQGSELMKIMQALGGG